MPNYVAMVAGIVFGVVLIVCSLFILIGSLAEGKISFAVLAYFLLVSGGFLLFLSIDAWHTSDGWQKPPTAGVYKIAGPRDGCLPLIDNREDYKGKIVFHQLDKSAIAYIEVAPDSPKANTMEVVGKNAGLRKVTVYLPAKPVPTNTKKPLAPEPE